MAAAAPATYLDRLFASNANGAAVRVLSAYTLHSWSQVYPALRIDQVATPIARPIIKRIASVCVAVDQNSVIAAGLLAQLLRISYLHSKPWETEPWKGLIVRNSPGANRIDAPVLITQGLADQLVRPPITGAFVEQLCREGEKVSYRTFAGVDHIHAGPDTAWDVAVRIADRFAGKPARSTCK